MSEYSKRLQEAKRELGYSNEQIAHAAQEAGFEISKYTVTQSLNGKHGQVTANTVRALARALRVPYAELARLASLPSGDGNFRLEGRVAEYADALTKQQADVVRETMRLFAEGNQAAGQLPKASAAQEAKAAADRSEVDERGDYDLAAMDEGELPPDDYYQSDP